MSDQHITDTGNGLIVGTDPPRPPQTTQSFAQTPAQHVSQPVQLVPQTPQPPNNGRWTDEDLERVRQQEKDKLYGRLEDLSGQVKTLAQEREAEKAERDRLAQEADALAKSKEESEMEVRDLLNRKEQEWNARLEQQQRQYEADRAVFEQERRLAELENYKRERLDQESQFIMPELRDLVTGSSPDQIDASIEAMKARSEQIVAAFMAEQPPVRGASTTAPTVGPMEQLPQYESLSPEDIKGMDMETYRRYRDQLLAASNPNRTRGR